MQLNRKSTWVLAAVLLASSHAMAAKYAVVFKNKEAFKQTTQKMVSAQTYAQFGTFSLEKTLPNVQAFIVDAKDEAALQGFKNQGATIVKEVMYPAPAPVNGFHMTRAWDFTLNYAVKAMDAIGTTGSGTPWGINAVNAPGAWALSNYGQGARVAVLDTGIDRDHPALKDAYEQGENFVGDANSPYPDSDTEGHGSHVSGTIAARFGADGFVGVAPQAKILMGRVCSTDGCSNMAIIQGIDWAIQQHVDVISMSLGGPWGTSAEAQAVSQANAAGIVVVAASGNDGQASVSYPAAEPEAIAVGAVDSTLTKASFSNWGPELAIVAPGVAVTSSVPRGTGREAQVSAGANGDVQSVNASSFVGSPDISSPMTNTLVYCGKGQPADFQGVNVKGQFALIERGDIAFADKATNAIAAGATGVVIFNNAPGLIQGALTQDGSTMAIPVVMVEQSVGQALVAALQAGQSASATMATLKTDYATFDGTSMATPHVAGVVALLKAANHSLTPAQVRTAITSTAQALGPNDQNQYGAGMINAAAAVQSVAQ